MKSSINFLPAEKRRDLHQLVEIIRNEIKDCVMIILYGSYARNTYVECDERRDFGVKTYFMSDYDILVVTKKRKTNKANFTPGRNSSTKVFPG